MIRFLRPGLSLLLAAGLALPGWAQTFHGLEGYVEEEEQAWSELETRLPPYPEAENLIEFRVSPTLPFRYFVDAASIQVGQDGVVRYVLVVRGSDGTNTVSFEGMRCATRELKRYAFGRGEGLWSKARNPRWIPIEAQRQTLHQRVLYYDFFCPGKMPVRTPEEAVAALKAGIHPESLNAVR
ncbi:CNP1-like family protein [Pelomicrobium sp.]|jgi:hypothetical protein|uniref:CNP1-like family protein n=1 Tax=Pelomicrobium sp. TaxID=2815319 RepID=UPI002FDCBC08